MAKSPKDSSENNSGNDEIDPELVKLPRPKSQVRPILALAIIGICLTLMVRLWDDLSFSRMGPTPRVVATSELNDSLDNEYVEITAIPDRPQALRLVPSRSTTGQVLMPVLGSKGALWLLVPTTPWSGPGRLDERYQGRLTRMADMEFHDELVDYFNAGHQVPRPIPLEEVSQAVQRTLHEVHDASGDPLRITPETSVHVFEVATEKVEVLAIISDSYNDEATWTLALQNAGILPTGQPAVSSTAGSWTFHVPAPAGVLGVREALATAKLWAAKASEISSTRSGRWSELSVDAQKLQLGEGNPGFEIRSVALGITPPLPAGAFLLNTTEEPGTYWYVMSLVIALGLFSLLFGFGILRAARVSR